MPLSGCARQHTLSCMSGTIQTRDLHTLAAGLNIEGCRPWDALDPAVTTWLNIVQVIDKPLEGDTFDMVMDRVRANKYEFIEQAVGVDIGGFIEQLTGVVRKLLRTYKNPLVHVHQYAGTTRLDKVLQEKTGVRTITDVTNFYESPVDYRVAYPDVDCVLSVSQCAGLAPDLPVGTWIVPTGYLTYDVTNDVIESRVRTVPNPVAPLLDFPHVHGAILVVNDLWNPSDLSRELLLLDTNDVHVLDFVKHATRTFDESHDWRHAVRVARNAMRICRATPGTARTPVEKQVLYLALLHDVCDHKYPSSIPRAELTAFITTHLPMYVDIDAMIEQISFSKQVMGTPVDPVVDIVRDADRLEALGEVGIRRCETLVRARGGTVPDDVIVHCFDKLLRLYDGFIVTDMGRQLAVAGHNYVIAYVTENLPKTSLTYDAPLPICA